MDRFSTKNSSQSDNEDIEESAQHESLTDDKDSENDSACSNVEETLTNESELRKASYYSEEACFRDVSKWEGSELKDSEVRELCQDIENSQSLSAEAKCVKHTRDSNQSSLKTSTTANAELVSFLFENVMDVPTRRAAASSSLTSIITSGSQTKSSEPLAVPSTSKDASGLAPALESSPKRPTNFGRNVKQAVHVFHPTNPRSILKKVPIPIHSGRWVYLRNSPESSDYGGSPDSLDDSFLMAALDVKTPENENEDMFTPRNEEMPSCPPPIQNPILDSPADEVIGIVGGLQCAPSHTKRTFGHVPSDHSKQNIDDCSFEPRPIEGFAENTSLDIEDLPCANYRTESIYSDFGCMKMSSGDLLSESLTTELKYESSHSSRTNASNESENISFNNLEDSGNQLFEPLRMRRTSEDVHPDESKHIQIKMKDNNSESLLTEENMKDNLSEEFASELSNIGSNTVTEYRRSESRLAIEAHSSEESNVECFDDTHLELNESNSSPEKTKRF